MCSPDLENIVRAEVSALVKMHRSFTGQDLFQRLTKKGIRRAVPLSKDQREMIVQAGQREISHTVRQLFNAGFIGFSSYGSTLVAGGPVMYFPIPAHAKLRAAKIQESIKPLITGAPSQGPTNLQYTP